MDIGTIGIWTTFRPFGIDRAGEAARLAEQLGYGAWWVGGSPQAADLRPILEATSTLVTATGIVNVWNSDPAATAAADAELRSSFAGRFMLGVGIGHPEAYLGRNARRECEHASACRHPPPGRPNGRPTTGSGG